MLCVYGVGYFTGLVQVFRRYHSNIAGRFRSLYDRQHLYKRAQGDKASKAIR
jgi:hypothetical protein